MLQELSPIEIYELTISDEINFGNILAIKWINQQNIAVDQQMIKATVAVI